MKRRDWKKLSVSVAAAIAASAFGGAWAQAEGAAFTKPITGVAAADAVYAESGILAEDGKYVFTEDTKISASGGAVALASAAPDTIVIDAAGKVLSLASEGGNAVSFGAHALTITAGELHISSNGSGRTEGIDVRGNNKENTNGLYHLTVNGDTYVTSISTGKGYALGVYANGNAAETFNGNVTMRAADGGYGVTNGEEPLSYYEVTGLYAGSTYKNNGYGGGHIVVNGGVDLYVQGNGIWANGDKASVVINGGGAIEIGKNAAYENYAILASSGYVSMNVLKDESGNASGAGTNTVTIKGNIAAADKGVSVDEPTTETAVELGLSTAESTWTGVAYNAFGTDGVAAGDKLFTGRIDLWLANGATWNNEAFGYTAVSGSYGGIRFNGSHIAKLTGGASAETAGNIFMKDVGEKEIDSGETVTEGRDLTIDAYSGFTNIYYAHTGDGTASADYAAGNTVISTAKAGASVALITDNAGITASDDSQVSKVLNALAGKLIYSEYTSGAKNLTGTVKIADGLTASSKALAVGDITFDKKTGQGTYEVIEEAPAFSATVTGVADDDKAYADYIGEDGVYRFPAGASITPKLYAVNVKKAGLTIDAGTKTLTLSNSSGDWSGAVGIITQGAAGTTTIRAGKLDVTAYDNSWMYEKDGISVSGSGADEADRAVLNIEADTAIHAEVSMGEARGITAKENSEVNITGDLTIGGVKNSQLRNSMPLGGKEVAGLYAYSYTGTAASIGVTGSIDIKTRGHGIAADGSGSSVTVGGGAIAVNKSADFVFYALGAESGTINMNVNADATAAGSTATNISGNSAALTGTGQKRGDSEKKSVVNLGLSGKESSWTGLAYQEAEKDGYTASIRLFLDDGASWKNEKYGNIKDFSGSHLASLTGGKDAASAGVIYASDSNDLTIDHYSGHAVLIYEHTGDGTKSENYSAGNTVIKSAAAGSGILVLTDSTDMDTADTDAVTNALNTLAGKLYYTGIIGNAETNLKGKVEIADGLTASAKSIRIEDIVFDTETGRGGLTSGSEPAPEEQVETEFTDPITGERTASYVKAGVQQADNSYIFTKDSTVTINDITSKVADPDWAGSYIVSGAAIQNGKDVDAVNVDAGETTLTLHVATDENTALDPNAGVLHNRIPLYGIDNSTAGSTTTVKAGTVDIQMENLQEKEGQYGIGAGNVTGIHAESEGEAAVIRVESDVKIAAKGKYQASGIRANKNGKITVAGDVSIKGADSEWGLDSYVGGEETTSALEYSWLTGAGLFANGENASVTVDGKTDMTVRGASGIAASAGGTVTAKGADVALWRNTDAAHYYYAAAASFGTVNINAENGTAGTDTVKLLGNVGVLDTALSQGYAGTNKISEVNIGLSGKDSSWTGAAVHGIADNDEGYEGRINLFLADGAGWTNETYGATLGDTEGEPTPFAGSRIANLAGGASEAKAGHIFQNDKNSLTIDSYSGFTNIYYAHTSDGDEAADYAAGDTIISKAAAGSGISLITDNSGIDTSDSGLVSRVLNAIAGKLVYSAYAENERNLTGKVTIASGLTASAASLTTGDITFIEATGRGSYAEKKAPEGPKTYTQQIVEDNYLGDSAREYWDKEGVRKEKEYTFTEDTTLDVSASSLEMMTWSKEASAIRWGGEGNGTIDMGGHKLTLSLGVSLVPSPTGGYVYPQSQGIYVHSEDLVIKNAAGIDITLTKNANGNGIYVNGYKQNGTFYNGDGNAALYIKNDDAAEHAVKFHSESEMTDHGIYVNQNTGSAKLSVTGLVDIDVVNSALTNRGGDVYIGGGSLVSHKSDAIQNSLGGTLLVNAARDAEGNLSAASEERDVKLEGNILAGNTGTIAAALATENSSFRGVVRKVQAESVVDLILKNGASWTNEETNYTESSFTGSELSSLTGGESAASAGNIFQNDTKALTIEDYSGYTNIYYAHDGDGSAASNYAAGDTVIGKAAKGSSVTLITDNSGITMTDEDKVADVLNALAGKLVYSAYAGGEENLAGKVTIASGLTASSASLTTGDITYIKDSGRGSYVKTSKPDPTPEPTPEPTPDPKPGIETGDYETLMMKGVRSATLSSNLLWRNLASDIYHRNASMREIGEKDGIWAKVLGGRMVYDANNANFKTNYWGAQVGYDKAFANGWNAGVGIDYIDGDSDYILSGKGDNTLYAFGLYASKDLGDGAYFDAAVKVGRIESDYSVYNELGTKLSGDYKTTGYSLAMQYGKRFGSEKSYIEPQVELTFARAGSKSYNAVSGSNTLHVDQDSYNSIVGRIGVEAGSLAPKGSFFGRVSLAHEFDGDIEAEYYAADGGAKRTSFDGKDTWAELTLGGRYQLSPASVFYADFTRSFGGDYENRWKLNAGLRFSF